MGGRLPFFEKLERAIEENNSLLCVGLDPVPERLPAGVDALEFNRRIIDATVDLVCAYKPNFAFYEALGLPGLEVLRRTIEYIPSRIPVILDAKRADIGPTAAAYARAAFEVWGADAITVQPYLGADSIAPFTAYADRGVFVLCHTSNPGAQDLQELPVARVLGEKQRPLYQLVAELVVGWSTVGNVGLVVGATYPEELQQVRQLAPQAWLLVPGVGAQGGDLEAAVRAGLRHDGRGLIINVSRAVIYAADPRTAAERFRDRIRAAALQPPISSPRSPPSSLRQLTFALHRAGCVQFGDFLLHSGRRSPIYLDLRLLASHPDILRQVARAYATVLRHLTFNRLAAIPYAALPIGTAVALETGWPLIYPRKEVKAHGTGRAIEGHWQPGETVVLLDDLITTGASKLEAIAPLEAAGLVVRDIVVLIDRGQGGREELAARGYRLHSVLQLSQMVDALHAEGRITDAQRDAVRAMLKRVRRVEAAAKPVPTTNDGPV